MFLCLLYGHQHYLPKQDTIEIFLFCTVGWCEYLRAAPLELQPVTRIIVSALLVRYPVVGEGEDTRLVPVSGCLAPAIHLLVRQTTRHIQGVATPFICALLT